MKHRAAVLLQGLCALTFIAGINLSRAQTEPPALVTEPQANELANSSSGALVLREDPDELIDQGTFLKSPGKILFLGDSITPCRPLHHRVGNPFPTTSKRGRGPRVDQSRIAQRNVQRPV